MFSVKEMVKEISKASGLSEDDVKHKIEDKQLELSGLVSPEGAAYIVGKELGANLLGETVNRRLKIKNVTPGLRSADITGRIIRISNRRDFEKDGKTKGVVNLDIGDETGTIKFSLWDNEIELLSRLGVGEGDAIDIRNGYVKETNTGNVEIRLGRKGRFSKSELKIAELDEIKKSFEAVKAKKISELREAEYDEIRASLVQIFRRHPFFEVCPKCESRIENVDGVWKCKEHDSVEPKYNLVLSGVLDDGSGNIRVVFFRELAEKVFGMDANTLQKMAKGKGGDEEIYEKLQLGKELVIRGRVKKNQVTEKLELVASDVEEVDPKRESEKLVKEIEGLKIKNLR
jgi:ssDNA-binding replication factor A large subunit